MKRSLSESVDENQKKCFTDAEKVLASLENFLKKEDKVETSLLNDVKVINQKDGYRVGVTGVLGAGKSEFINRILSKDFKSSECRSPLVSRLGGSSVTKNVVEISYGPSFVLRVNSDVIMFDDETNLSLYLYKMEDQSEPMYIQGPFVGLSRMPNVVLIDTPGLGMGNPFWMKELGTVDVLLCLASRVDHMPWEKLVASGLLNHASFPGVWAHGCFFANDDDPSEIDSLFRDTLKSSMFRPSSLCGEVATERKLCNLFDEQNRIRVFDRSKPVHDLIMDACQRSREIKNSDFCDAVNALTAYVENGTPAIDVSTFYFNQMGVWCPFPVSTESMIEYGRCFLQRLCRSTDIKYAERLSYLLWDKVPFDIKLSEVEGYARSIFETILEWAGTEHTGTPPWH